MSLDFDVKRAMFFSTLAMMLCIFLRSAITGGLKRGISDSIRNSGLRMDYMQEVLRAFDDAHDVYEVLYSREKEGRAYVEVQFNDLDWDRSAKNDLYRTLSKQGWSERSNGSTFCKDGASLKISGNAPVSDGHGHRYLIMEYSSASIHECS
jgi:hypothetical protein